jgi:hypothetical protein
MVDRKSWEYKRIICSLDFAELKFSAVGSAGWELVSVIHVELSDEEKKDLYTGNRVVGYFKREIL